MAYGVDGLRASFIGLSQIGVATDVVVLAIVATLFLILGARAFSRIQV
jgi:ABC-2 type transport system permease protein